MRGHDTELELLPSKCQQVPEYLEEMRACR